MGMAPIGLAQVMGRSVSDGDREGGILWLAKVPSNYLLYSAN